MLPDLYVFMVRQDEELEQLLKQDPITMGMLGKQVVHNRVYRPLTYVLTAEEAGRKIYYNLLTHEMILVEVSELESPKIKQYLIENWFLVPKEHDDQQLVDECRSVLRLMDSWPKKIHVFHIFTTLDCNARCYYCFEKRIPESNMTIATANRVIEYIQEQADGEPIYIVWFGGEPLFNYQVIDVITTGLWEKGLQFESKMISNGLLFDRTLEERAKKHWNVKSVQITLDGTGQVYKRTKAYVTDIEDPFERVIQNIKILLADDIKVVIRLNVGLYNYSDMRELVDFLCEEFRGEKNLYIYTSPLNEIIKYKDEKKSFMYDILDELNSKLDLFFEKKKKKEFADKISNSYCMATGREAVTILPDGKVGICEGITKDAFLGDIYSKKFDIKMREAFGRRFYREDKCRPCPLYPECYIVNGCPNKDSEEGCDSVKIQRQIRKITESLKTRCRMEVFCNGAGSAQ